MSTSFGRTLRGLLLLGLLAACGSAPVPDSSAASLHTYTITYFAQPESPKATVTAQIPGMWTETLDADGAPSFTIPGNTGIFTPMIVALGSDRPDINARMEQALELQYGKGTPNVTRTPFDNGRIWAVRNEETVIHARMFIPAPHGVVMAVALVKHTEADRLAEIEAVFHTVQVQADPAAPTSP